jgi:hypothetical protein
MARNMPQEIFEHTILELTQPNTVCDLGRQPGFFNSGQCCAPHATAQADLISSGCFHERSDLLKSDLLYFIKRQANSLYQRFQTVSAFLSLGLFWRVEKTQQSAVVSCCLLRLIGPLLHAAMWPQPSGTRWLYGFFAQNETIMGKSYRLSASYFKRETIQWI